MLVVLSDTHGTESPRLTPHLEETLAEADLLVHAGDFTTERVLDAFESRVDRLVAVAGNSDSTAVRKRLPETTTVEWDGLRLVLTHGHRHDETALSLLARQETADVAVVGHTHSPGSRSVGDLTILNPGSHADPRGSRSAYLAIERAVNAPRGEFRTVKGRVFQTVEL